jgi:glycosyltransferase involved in cell wall biosynthesis
MVKLLLVTPVMHMGGAERCIANLLKHLDRDRFSIDLVMIFDREMFYPIPSDVWTHILERDPLPPVPSVKVEIPLQLLGMREDLIWLELMALKLAEVIRQRQPDIVLARHLFSSILCCISRKYWPKGTRLVVSADNHASTMLSNHPHGPIYSFVIREHFSDAEAIIALSEGVAEDLVTNYSVSRNKIAVIPNPVDLAEIRQCIQEPVDHNWFVEPIPIVVAMGRFVPQKGFDYLLRAFALIHRYGLLVRLVLLGDGEERQRLESLAAELGIQEHVWFAGKQRNPFKYIARSTVFVLSSLHEGFANVIAEALACGCPIVSTDCPSGPAEILQNGKYGLLVPPRDENALSQAMLKLLANPPLRNELSRLGFQRASEFDAPRVTQQYESLILKTLKANIYAS